MDFFQEVLFLFDFSEQKENETDEPTYILCIMCIDYQLTFFIRFGMFRYIISDSLSLLRFLFSFFFALLCI